ncbi:nucleoside deoxyribosyltransferase [Companilactobacillus sp. RD055328]|uniref:nucleoside 2-deoxyribosyltransferase n=1 Tax=Companilactobacillus sp. RD055328 TaxID=2916634 RepID=UPI001FC86681|nr:nucleoside 2-deoxyribosyltransferase [Companilactobacillus sp. RD055328]GKQ43221.1 nucleoside deoxyribosyltransferase [Companilactobacillus sp. RD055328]
MRNIYLAAPFFDEKQIERRDKMVKLLNENPTVNEVFIPGEHEEDTAFEFGTLEWQVATFKLDTNQIDVNDIVVGILDYEEADTSDPGTIWELGYASASKMPTIAVKFGDSNKLNLMLARSLTAFFNGEEDVENIKNYDFNLLQTRFSDYEVF